MFYSGFRRKTLVGFIHRSELEALTRHARCRVQVSVTFDPRPFPLNLVEVRSEFFSRNSYEHLSGQNPKRMLQRQKVCIISEIQNFVATMLSTQILTTPHRDLS